MKIVKIMIAGLGLLAFSALAQDPATSPAVPTEMSCDDFTPTTEAQRRFAELEGACEAIVDRGGKLFAKTTAIVRRVTAGSVRLYPPPPDHTFTVRPGNDNYVLADGVKTRPRDLVRGQEIRIYISVEEFGQPVIDEIALVTEVNEIVEIEVEVVAALPTTASELPALGLAGGLLLLGAGLIRRVRTRSS
jgi:hypothetical protein